MYCNIEKIYELRMTESEIMWLRKFLSEPPKIIEDISAKDDDRRCEFIEALDNLR